MPTIIMVKVERKSKRGKNQKDISVQVMFMTSRVVLVVILAAHMRRNFGHMFHSQHIIMRPLHSQLDSKLRVISAGTARLYQTLMVVELKPLHVKFHNIVAGMVKSSLILTAVKTKP